MDSIAVILQHSGHWNEDETYINFQVRGLLIPNNCNYSNLVGMICNELKLQPELTLMKIEYQVKDGYPPFNIVDDLQLMFYIELKKKESDFRRYPLCLTTDMNSIQPTFLPTGSEITTNHLCIEVAQAEDAASNLVHQHTDESNKVADYIDFAEVISRQILDIPNEATTEDEVIENLVISNKNHQRIALNQTYIDKETLKIILSHYAINNNFQYQVLKSCKMEYLVACLDKNCKWMLRASRNGNTNQFIIRKLIDSHTCALEIRFKEQRQATTAVIADIIKNKFTNIKTKYTAADIIRDMKQDHNVQVNYNKAWRSKEKALEIMRGNATESYAELLPYLYMLHSTNPGSRIEIKADENACFLYVFVALNASMKGLTHCIHVVVVDGTFLKSTYGGTLLVAATQDAGGKTFPLAFCVVDSENDDSWYWFFDKFRKAYSVREDMTIISDRHESIVKGASTVYPEVPHVVCIFHLLNNIKSKFKKNSKTIKDAFFSAANAYTVKKFEYHMKQLDKIDKRIKPFLEQVGYDKWARVHSRNNRYSNLTSNVAESLNSVSIAIRELPICTMLECFRALIQRWSWTNRNTANATSTRLTNKFEEILKNNYLYSMNLTVNPTNDILFEVHNADRKSVVDLSLKTCTCNRFQMDQLPCAHAIAVLQKINHDPYEYCSPYYTKEAMVAAYREIVYPVGNKDTWEVPEHVKSMTLYPPEGRIRVGRPKKRRRKASWEKNKKPLLETKCGKCGQNGHNKRTCRNPQKMN